MRLPPPFPAGRSWTQNCASPLIRPAATPFSRRYASRSASWPIWRLTPPPRPRRRPPETTRAQVILARRGQGLYRERLLAAWGGACAVTGLAEPAFLVASHAKPWSNATDAERLDGENGLPLVPNLDKLFDKGWISFGDDGAVLLSPALSAEAAAALGVTPSLRLRLPLSDRQKTYLRAHRDKVFKK